MTEIKKIKKMMVQREREREKITEMYRATNVQS